MSKETNFRESEVKVLDNFNTIYAQIKRLENKMSISHKPINEFDLKTLNLNLNTLEKNVTVLRNTFFKS